MDMWRVMFLRTYYFLTHGCKMNTSYCKQFRIFRVCVQNQEQACLEGSGHLQRRGKGHHYIANDIYRVRGGGCYSIAYI